MKEVLNPHVKQLKRVDFMQYDEAFYAPLTREQEDVLSAFGQFFSSTSDFEFLTRLRSGKAKRKERDEWFLENEGRAVYNIAQGILASVYVEDPP